MIRECLPYVTKWHAGTSCYLYCRATHKRDDSAKMGTWLSCGSNLSNPLPVCEIDMAGAHRLLQDDPKRNDYELVLVPRWIRKTSKRLRSPERVDTQCTSSGQVYKEHRHCPLSEPEPGTDVLLRTTAVCLLVSPDVRNSRVHTPPESLHGSGAPSPTRPDIRPQRDCLSQSLEDMGRASDAVEYA